jgi:hypothetical protein
LRPAEIRFILPPGWSLGDVPELPSDGIAIDGDRVLVRTREAVRATNLLTGWALERGVELGHFSVAQPTLEDIYLELTRSTAPEAPSPEETLA